MAPQSPGGAPIPARSRPPTLDEFRATTAAEIRAAIERALTGPPQPPPRRRRPTDRTGFLPGLAPGARP
jgi:hypothetical protein